MKLLGEHERYLAWKAPGDMCYPHHLPNELSIQSTIRQSIPRMDCWKWFAFGFKHLPLLDGF